MTSTVSTTFEICGGIEAVVEGVFHPYRPAYTPRGEYAPMDPPEPAMVEDITVTVNGEEVDVDGLYVKRRFGDGYIAVMDLIEEALINSVRDGS